MYTPSITWRLVKLLGAGYKVGLVRQTETAALRKAGDDGGGARCVFFSLVDAPPVWHPGPPGLTALLRRVDRSGKMFSRAIVAVYTPGAVLDDDDPSFADLLLRKKAVGAGGGGKGGVGDRKSVV